MDRARSEIAVPLSTTHERLARKDCEKARSVEGALFAGAASMQRRATILGLLMILTACSGGESSSDNSDQAVTAAAANPTYMLGHFGAYASKILNLEHQGEMETLGGPIAVRIARIGKDGRAFVTVLHTPTGVSAEGWAHVAGRSLTFPIAGAGANCALAMERKVGDDEKLDVKMSGTCAAPWGRTPELRDGTSLPRILQWWVDQRQGLYQTSFNLRDDNEDRIDISVPKSKGGPPSPALESIEFAKSGYQVMQLGSREIEEVSPTRLNLPLKVCPDIGKKPQIHFLADGSLELLNCLQQPIRYFMDGLPTCQALNVSSCASQEVLEKRQASPGTN